jgi:hypothetical protein
MDNQNENKINILESNLVINATGCKEENLRLIVSAIIEGVKDSMHGIPVNLQINLYSQDGVLQTQNQSNLTGDGNEKWNN